ncbi:MAG: hypothetical protein U0Z44_22175 [Kouleothrix sp.]
MIAWCLAGLGSVAALSDDPVQAVRLWAMADTLRAGLGCRAAQYPRYLRAAVCACARATRRRGVRCRMGQPVRPDA